MKTNAINFAYPFNSGLGKKCCYFTLKCLHMHPQWFTQAKENWLPPQEWTVIPFKNEDDQSFTKVTQVSSSKACKMKRSTPIWGHFMNACWFRYVSSWLLLKTFSCTKFILVLLYASNPKDSARRTSHTTTARLSMKSKAQCMHTCDVGHESGQV